MVINLPLQENHIESLNSRIVKLFIPLHIKIIVLVFIHEKF